MDYVQIGSSKLPDSDKEHLRNLLPNSRLYDFYGSTEAGCSCLFDFNKYADIKGCIGRPSIYSYYKFFDENGNEMKNTSFDNPGRLAGSGPTLMTEYYKDEELTKETIKDGYIISSDMGYMGEDGMIYFLGRQDDVINVGGNKVDPYEVEEIASKYPDVIDCACTAMDDPIAGSVPKLYIQMKKGIELETKALYEYLQPYLEGYKLPKQIEVIDKIPRTFNGKLIRRELK